MASGQENDAPKLSELFSRLLDACNYFESTDDPTVSEKVQSRVERCTADGELAIRMINELSLFSENEELEELATADMRYLLTPALLGYTTSKSTKQDRLGVVKKAKDYHTDYLRLSKSYGLTDIELPGIQTEGENDQSDARVPPIHGTQQEVKAMANQRQKKIERFKQQKKTEQQLKELRQYIEKDHVDDETKRKYYLTLIERWILKSQEELESLESEVSILEHMAKMRSSGQKEPANESKPPQQPRPPFRPVILTKDLLQKQVFGAGYPSLPTYTVEEFFDQQMAAGNVPQPYQGSLQNAANNPESEAEQQDKEEAEKERKVEEDDEETLQKAREWDDWKDDHRRGWGNTQNKG